MRHVLMIGKDPEVQNLVTHALEGKHELSITTSEEDSIRFLAEQPPELILMAAAYVRQKGSELFDMTRVLPSKNIPVLLLIKQGDKESEELASKHGFADYITIPCPEAVILNRVNNQLELHAYRTNAMKYAQYQDAISVSIAELVECRDITTGGHLKNTTAYFKLLLEEFNRREDYTRRIPEEDVRDLIRSAPLHDIGKIGINDEILRKASPLDFNEFEYMKTHTILAKETFEKIMKETGESRFLILARDLAYCHHERWDGTGYPNGLQGEEIPFYARILAIADVYDALTSRRTYKKAFSHEEAVDIIRQGRGTLFDPEIVDLFLQIKDQFEQALRRKYITSAES